MRGDAQAVDLTNCDREPIHIPGTIQSFGFLIAVSSDWLISRVSLNIGEFLPGEPAALLGTPLRGLIAHGAEHLLRNMASQLRGPDAIERTFNVALLPDGAPFDVAIHYSGRSLVIEAEPVLGRTIDAAMVVPAWSCVWTRSRRWQISCARAPARSAA